MKTVRIAVTLGFIGRALLGASVGFPALAATGALVTGCADENDPKTWVTRLDDPAKRAEAIRRLSSAFDSKMGSANNNREDAQVSAFIDMVAEPLTKQYTSGTVDEKTRAILIKFIADLRDPKTAPALAKALNDYEPNKSDEDVKWASQTVTEMKKAGKLSDQSLIDGVWNAFAKYQPSKVGSSELTKSLATAVMTIKDPSYAPKAITKLEGPVADTPDSKMDQLMFWQATSIRLLRELKFGGAAKPLVKVMLMPSKADLAGVATAALRAIPKEATDALAAALDGSDPELAKMVNDYPDKVSVAIVADAISAISLPKGKQALLAALPKADSDTSRVAIAGDLTRFPSEPAISDALVATYKKLAPGVRLKTPGEPFGRPYLAQTAEATFDPKLTEWLAKEVTDSKGDEGASMQNFALPSAIKLMTKEQAKVVEKVAMKVWNAKEQSLFTEANAVLQQCDKDAACYVTALAAPPKDQVAMRHSKAAWGAAMYGNQKTLTDLVALLPKIKASGVRLAVGMAIDHLAPKGDAAVAAELDKIVAATNDDALSKIADKLRARSGS